MGLSLFAIRDECTTLLYAEWASCVTKFGDSYPFFAYNV